MTTKASCACYAGSKVAKASFPKESGLNRVSASFWPLISAVLLVSSSILWPSRVLAQSNTQNSNRGVEAVPSTALAQSGAWHALVIGNNNYQHFDKLSTAVADADEIGRILHDSYGFEVTKLLDATRPQIMSELGKYRGLLGEESSLLIYYAGHGQYDTDADKAYWLPTDAERDNKANWISADDVNTSIKTMRARHVLIISDSCYSGMMNREGNVKIAENPLDFYLEKMLRLKSRTFIASGANEPVADRGGSGHSVFAAAVIEALRNPGEAVFTSETLFSEHIAIPVAGGSSQTPGWAPIRNSGHAGGDFVFVRRDGLYARPPSAPTAASVPASEWRSLIAKMPGDPAFRIAVAGIKDSYVSGEKVSLTMSTTKDCYVYLFTVSDDLSVTIFFPNPYRRDNLLKTGQKVVFPDDRDLRNGIELRVGLREGESHDAKESIVAIALKHRLDIADMTGIRESLERSIGSGETDLADALVRRLQGIPGVDLAYDVKDYMVKQAVK